MQKNKKPVKTNTTVSFKLNNFKWTLKFRPLECYGITRYATFEVILNQELLENISNQNIHCSLIHELVHAFKYSYGMFHDADSEVAAMSEEQVCEFIAMNAENIIELAYKLEKQFFAKYKK